MTRFVIQAPDGRVVTVDAASKEAALAGVADFVAKTPTKAYAKALKDARTPYQGADWVQQALGPETTKTLREAQAGAMKTLNQGPMLGWDDELAGAANAGLTGVRNLVGAGPGYGMKDAYKAARQARQEVYREFEGDHPVAGVALPIAGGFLTPGMGALGDFVGGAKGAKGLLQGADLGSRVVRGGAVGALLGGIAGAGSADDGDRLAGFGEGALAGDLTGSILPLGSAAGGKVVKTAARLANKASGGKLLDASREAGRRLAEALRKDGLTPDAVREAMNAWLKTGASAPTLMDLAGPNTKRLIRAAAAKEGPANVAALQHEEKIAANLQDNAIARTRKLTPDTRPALEIAEELKAAQGGLADKQYAEPYAAPVPITEDIASAVRDEPGQAAVRRAIKGAIARRDYEAAGRLQSLLNLDVGDIPQFSPGAMERVRAAAVSSAPDVTAGDLDRVKIALGERGQGAMNATTPSRDVAGGLFARAGDIDTALDNVPGLQPARDTYKAMGAQREALDLGSSQPFDDPETLIAKLQQLTAKATPEGNPHPVSAEDIQAAAGQGVRDNVVRNIGAPAQGSTGYLNRLATGTNPERVMGEVYGADEASNYRAALQHEIDKLKNARFINPSNGSQTAHLLEDKGLIDALPHGLHGGALVRFAVDKLMKGASLTDAERHAIVSLGTDHASVLEKIAPLLDLPPPQVRSIPLTAGVARSAVDQ